MLISNPPIHPMEFTDNPIGINELIYKKLIQLIPDLPESDGSACKRISQVSDRRDLQYIYIQKQEGSHYITLSHEYIADNGIDTAPDPEIMIRVVPEKEFAEAITYQNRYVYRRAYQEHEDEPYIHYRILAELNESLSNWLSRLIVYGHQLDGREHDPLSLEPRGQRTINRAPDNGVSAEFDLSR